MSYHRVASVPVINIVFLASLSLIHNVNDMYIIATINNNLRLYVSKWLNKKCQISEGNIIV